MRFVRVACLAVAALAPSASDASDPVAASRRLRERASSLAPLRDPGTGITRDVGAIRRLVRNDVAGIGLPPINDGPLFGSPGRLKGYVDMGFVGQYRVPPFSTQPGDPRASLTDFGIRLRGDTGRRRPLAGWKDS